MNPAGQTFGLHMGGSSIAANPGLVMNSEFTWDDQVSKICHSVSMDNVADHKLVTALIIQQFLYCDVFFAKSTARLRERL
jgi:hypothetical protein